MNIKFKKHLFSLLTLASLFLTTNLFAQSTACCASDKAKTAACATKKADCKTTKTATSGCSPSACRGAKTKFGEAKVISNLRLSLIDLKAEMEKSTSPKFDARSYDLHGIIGDSDDKSLAIISDEVQVVETAFAKYLDYDVPAFQLPENKAKQVQFLNARIEALKKLL